MTTTTAAALEPTRLIIAALTGLVILLLLIIKFKVQAMISILVGSGHRPDCGYAFWGHHKLCK